MPRHQGLLIDAGARTVTTRDDVLPLDLLEQSGDALYFAYASPQRSRICYHEGWLVPAQGWAINRFVTHPHAEPFSFDWYIDLDHITVSGDRWHAGDRLLDLVIHEGRGYEVFDADELADALDAGEIAPDEASATLRALQVLALALQGNGFSGRALLEKFAPGLPR